MLAMPKLTDYEFETAARGRRALAAVLFMLDRLRRPSVAALPMGFRIPTACCDSRLGGRLRISSGVVNGLALASGVPRPALDAGDYLKLRRGSACDRMSR